jgi:hypothetical protein
MLTPPLRTLGIYSEPELGESTLYINCTTLVFIEHLQCARKVLERHQEKQMKNTYLC